MNNSVNHDYLNKNKIKNKKTENLLVHEQERIGILKLALCPTEPSLYRQHQTLSSKYRQLLGSLCSEVTPEQRKIVPEHHWV